MASFSILCVNAFESFALAVSGGALDVLEGFCGDTLLDAGVNPARVREWSMLHQVYFGATRFTRKQALAAAHARAGGHSLDQLVFIEGRLKAIGDETERWRLRIELLKVRGNYETLRRRAKEILPAADPTPPKKQVRFTRSRAGRRSFTATADERDIADLEHYLRRGLDAAKPESPQMLAAFLDLIRGEDAGVAHAAPRPIVLVPLPEWTRIVGGCGNDTELMLTDGTTITGAEFLQRHYGETLEVAAFHPEEGPVNLYRTARLANRKQRDLARMTSPACPVPGCRHGADSCEIHHIEPWKHGGETNIGNLAPVCRYHNRTNNDDANVPGRARRAGRGRIENIRGAPMWVSPRGYPVANWASRFGAMAALFGDPLSAV